MIVQASLGGSGGGGGGSIPAGTTGQTLYYASNGTTVTPTSNLLNNGTNVSVTGNFDVYGIAPDYAGTSLLNIDATLGIASLGDWQGLVNGTSVKVLDTTGDLTVLYNATNGHTFIGRVGVGAATSTSPLAVAGLQSFATNAAALLGGLAVGDFYRISVAGTSTVAVVE